MTNSGKITIGILQPGYLPWLGFFEQLQKSDVFVIYDDVQYDRGSWRNRNRIKTVSGTQWLTVPVLVKFMERLSVNEIKIDNHSDWKKKHLASIKLNYSKAPFYSKYIDIFEAAYTKEWEYLVDLDMHFILTLAELFGIDSKKIKMSSVLRPEGDKNSRLISLCKMFNAGIFYEGAAGKNYIDEAVFKKEGINVAFQDYKHPVYPQLYGDFISHLSVVDLLFNCGPESLDVIMGSN